MKKMLALLLAAVLAAQTVMPAWAADRTEPDPTAETRTETEISEDPTPESS